MRFNLILFYLFWFFLRHVCLSVPSVSLTGLVQRCVIIQKDDNGFGLTVSGDNPVFVQLVKEGKIDSQILKMVLLQLLDSYHDADTCLE